MSLRSAAIAHSIAARIHAEGEQTQSRRLAQVQAH